jgi:hypothetical protein
MVGEQHLVVHTRPQEGNISLLNRPQGKDLSRVTGAEAAFEPRSDSRQACVPNPVCCLQVGLAFC